MRALLRHMGVGLVLGTVTGIVARGFMALLTEDPHFSWAGTGFIVGVFAVSGLSVAAAYHLRTRRRSRWWKLLALPTVVIGFGPGMLMVPGIVGMALAASRRRWTRVLGALVIVGFAVLVVYLTLTSTDPFTVRTAAGLAVMFAVCAAVAAGLRVALTGWAPKRSGAAVASGEAQRDRADRSEGTGDGRSAEHPLDLHDGGVEELLGVGLVRQGGDG